MNGYFEALTIGAGNVFGWPNILIPTAGTLLAMLVSFLPGIGTTSVMAFMIILTLTWDPVSVLLLYGALVGGATFMGSVTAILFNIPGGAPNAATLLDGYPIARDGWPKTAIACAATASAVGSVIGVLILMALLPVMRPLLLEFGPLERFLLGIWGLVTIIAIPTKSLLKSAAMAALGLLVALVGMDPASARPRWTFGSSFLGQGFSLIAVLLGLFTIGELIGWTRRIELEAPRTGDRAADSTLAGIVAVFRHFGLTFRSSLIGTAIGIVPGIGGTVASFIAYGHAVQSARGDRAGFGQGDIRGLVAPEAAVDAKDGGSLLPTVAFGLPGSEGTAILLTVMLIHGLVPGIPMLTDQLPLTFTLILALLFSNLLTSVLGVALTPALARLTKIQTDKFAIAALVISLVSVVLLRGQQADLYVAVAFGLAGYFFKQFGWPRVPFVIAFILGELIERNFVLSVRLFEVGRLSVLEQPASMVLLALLAVSLLWMLRRPAGAAREPLGVGDLVVGSCLLLGTTVLAAIAFWAGGKYGVVPKLVILTTFGLLAAIVLGCVISLRQAAKREASASGISRGGLPGPHRIPLALLALSAPAVALTGFAPALGLLVFVWLALTGPATGWALARAIFTGLFASACIHYLATDVLHLLLPAAMLW